MKRTDHKSHCPINFSLEVVGDPWTLLVVRDIVFYGKHTFSEFMASAERITTSVLADRLALLVEKGILHKSPSTEDKRREVYVLTAKGLALIPVLVELANWGVAYDPDVVPNETWLAQSQADKAQLCAMIHDTVVAGGSVFSGDNSVIAQLRRNGDPGTGTE